MLVRVECRVLCRVTPEHLYYNKKFRVADKDIARLRLNLSHLNEHKFRPNLNDMINPMCKCSPDMLILKQIFIAFALPTLFSSQFNEWSSLMAYIN